MNPFIISSLALLFLYLAASPRFAQWYYRRRIFTDATSLASRPELTRNFDWKNKLQLSIPAEDGSRMNAWYFGKSDRPMTQKASTLAIRFIGRGSCISNCMDDIARLLDAGYAVLIGEYRGFGETGGELASIDSVCSDGLSFFDYAVNVIGYKPSQIVIVGESLGGGIASYVCKQRQPAALVLCNSFTSLPEIGREHVPLTRIFPGCLHPRNHLGTIEILRGWRHPLLVVHADHDEIIPVHHGRENFAACATSTAQKKLIALTHSTHRVLSPEAALLYRDGLMQMREIVEGLRDSF
jgi:pimeloyl-ACP methyl ester carboxylesterase